MRPTLLAALTAVAVLAAGCAGTAPPSGDAHVTLRDFAIEPGTAAVPAGPVRLVVTNAGPSVHELEVFTLPAGLDPGAIPVANGVADTASAGLTVVGEVEDVAPQTSTTLSVNVPPGRYALICNLPGHYGQGMHALLTAG